MCGKIWYVHYIFDKFMVVIATLWFTGSLIYRITNAIKDVTYVTIPMAYSRHARQGDI